MYNQHLWNPTALPVSSQVLSWSCKGQQKYTKVKSLLDNQTVCRPAELPSFFLGKVRDHAFQIALAVVRQFLFCTCRRQNSFAKLRLSNVLRPSSPSKSPRIQAASCTKLTKTSTCSPWFQTKYVTVYWSCLPSQVSPAMWAERREATESFRKSQGSIRNKPWLGPTRSSTATAGTTTPASCSWSLGSSSHSSVASSTRQCMGPLVWASSCYCCCYVAISIHRLPDSSLRSMATVPAATATTTTLNDCGRSSLIS